LKSNIFSSTLKNGIAYYSEVVGLVPGANSTYDRMTVSYSASVVKIYNTARSLVRFEIKTIILYFEKRCSLLPALALKL
jgi:hypothetical protein